MLTGSGSVKLPPRLSLTRHTRGCRGSALGRSSLAGLGSGFLARDLSGMASFRGPEGPLFHAAWLVNGCGLGCSSRLRERKCVAPNGALTSFGPQPTLPAAERCTLCRLQRSANLRAYGPAHGCAGGVADP